MANGEWEIEIGKGLRLKSKELEGRNMVFTVTCRGIGGGRETVEIEAADRGGVFAELKRRGMTAISVSEGKAKRTRRGASIPNGQGAGSPGQRKEFTSRWVAAAVIALIVAAVGVWWLWVAKDAAGRVPPANPAKPKPAPSAISNSAPPRVKAPAPEADASGRVAPPEAEKPKPRPPQRVGELRDGYRLLPDGTLHRVVGIVTNAPGRYSLADKTFKHFADAELGNLLMTQPGEGMLGESEGMYRGFKNELLKALEEPIAYSEDDTDLQRELKDGVKELREELKRRMANGEDIEKVMEDTREQLKELSLYREELEGHVMKLAHEGMTQADYEDLVAAANKMLDERGVKHLELPATLRRTLRLRKIQEDALRKELERQKEKEETR